MSINLVKVFKSNWWISQISRHVLLQKFQQLIVIDFYKGDFSIFWLQRLYLLRRAMKTINRRPFEVQERSWTIGISSFQAYILSSFLCFIVFTLIFLSRLILFIVKIYSNLILDRFQTEWREILNLLYCIFPRGLC